MLPGNEVTDTLRPQIHSGQHGPKARGPAALHLNGVSDGRQALAILGS